MEITAGQANLVSGARDGLRKDYFGGDLKSHKSGPGEGGGDRVEHSRCS